MCVNLCHMCVNLCPVINACKYMSYVCMSYMCVNIFHVFLNARFTHTFDIYLHIYVRKSGIQKYVSCMCVNVCNICV